MVRHGGVDLIDLELQNVEQLARIRSCIHFLWPFGGDLSMSQDRSRGREALTGIKKVFFLRRRVGLLHSCVAHGRGETI